MAAGAVRSAARIAQYNAPTSEYIPAGTDQGRPLDATTAVANVRGTRAGFINAPALHVPLDGPASSREMRSDDAYAMVAELLQRMLVQLQDAVTAQPELAKALSDATAQSEAFARLMQGQALSSRDMRDAAERLVTLHRSLPAADRRTSVAPNSVVGPVAHSERQADQAAETANRTADAVEDLNKRDEEAFENEQDENLRRKAAERRKARDESKAKGRKASSPQSDEEGDSKLKRAFGDQAASMKSGTLAAALSIVGLEDMSDSLETFFSADDDEQDSRDRSDRADDGDEGSRKAGLRVKAGAAMSRGKDAVTRGRESLTNTFRRSVTGASSRLKTSLLPALELDAVSTTAGTTGGASFVSSSAIPSGGVAPEEKPQPMMGDFLPAAPPAGRKAALPEARQPTPSVVERVEGRVTGRSRRDAVLNVPATTPDGAATSRVAERSAQIEWLVIKQEQKILRKLDKTLSRVDKALASRGGLLGGRRNPLSRLMGGGGGLDGFGDGDLDRRSRRTGRRTGTRGGRMRRAMSTAMDGLRGALGGVVANDLPDDQYDSQRRRTRRPTSSRLPSPAGDLPDTRTRRPRSLKSRAASTVARAGRAVATGGAAAVAAGGSLLGMTSVAGALPSVPTAPDAPSLPDTNAPRSPASPSVGGGTDKVAKSASKATAEVAEGGLKAAGKGATAAIGKGALRAAKFVPVAGQALAAGMAVYDGVQGWDRADENFQLKEGEEASTGQKASSAVGGIVSGLSFGLLDEGSTARSIHELGNSISSLFGDDDDESRDGKDGADGKDGKDGTGASEKASSASGRITAGTAPAADVSGAASDISAAVAAGVVAGGAVSSATPNTGTLPLTESAPVVPLAGLSSSSAIASRAAGVPANLAAAALAPASVLAAAAASAAVAKTKTPADDTVSVESDKNETTPIPRDATRDVGRIAGYTAAGLLGTSGGLLGTRAENLLNGVVDGVQDAMGSAFTAVTAMPSLALSVGGGYGNLTPSRVATSAAQVAHAAASHSRFTAKGDLGRVSAKYESGGRGVDTVSTGIGDAGGVSYGKHQLASKTGTMQAFLNSPEGAEFRNAFAGQKAGSGAFSDTYRQIAKTNGDAFEQAQQNFITRTHYTPVEDYAKQAGLDTSNPAIREALYSQSVQHGFKGNKRIIDDALSRVNGDSSNTDAFINSLYDARGDYASRFASSAATTARYARERKDVLAIARDAEASQGEVVQLAGNTIDASAPIVGVGITPDTAQSDVLGKLAGSPSSPVAVAQAAQAAQVARSQAQVAQAERLQSASPTGSGVVSASGGRLAAGLVDQSRFSTTSSSGASGYGPSGTAGAANILGRVAQGLVPRGASSTLSISRYSEPVPTGDIAKSLLTSAVAIPSIGLAPEGSAAAASAPPAPSPSAGAQAANTATKATPAAGALYSEIAGTGPASAEIYSAGYAGRGTASARVGTATSLTSSLQPIEDAPLLPSSLTSSLGATLTSALASRSGNSSASALVARSGSVPNFNSQNVVSGLFGASGALGTIGDAAVSSLLSGESVGRSVKEASLGVADGLIRSAGSAGSAKASSAIHGVLGDLGLNSGTASTAISQVTGVLESATSGGLSSLGSAGSQMQEKLKSIPKTLASSIPSMSTLLGAAGEAGVAGLAGTIGSTGATGLTGATGSSIGSSDSLGTIGGISLDGVSALPAALKDSTLQNGTLLAKTKTVPSGGSNPLNAPAGSSVSASRATRARPSTGGGGGGGGPKSSGSSFHVDDYGIAVMNSILFD